jgi:hypothetical protein
MHRISVVSVSLHILVLGISGVCADSVVPRFYHKTDFILDTFKRIALKQPGRVRYFRQLQIRGQDGHPM